MVDFTVKDVGMLGVYVFEPSKDRDSQRNSPTCWFDPQNDGIWWKYIMVLKWGIQHGAPISYWLVVYLGIIIPIYVEKNKNVPNHQPA